MIIIYDMGSYHIEAKRIDPAPTAQQMPQRQQYAASLQLLCVTDHPYGCEQPATLPPWLASRYINETDD